MSSRTVVIEPRDPVIFRDGKPFSAGLSAKSIGFPMPSTVIGAIRTRLGADSSYDAETVARLMQIGQTGPFLAERKWNETRWQVAFPAPADVVAYEMEGAEDQEAKRLEWHALRPSREEEGCDLPAGLLPLDGGKPDKVAREMPEFWHWAAMERYLQHGNRAVWTGTREEMGIGGLARQKRVHVSIQAETQSAEDGMLFTTEGLEFQTGLGGSRLSIVSRIREAGSGVFERVSHIGGEGRTAHWAADDDAPVDWPEAPEWLAGKGTRYVRLLLVTPGAFDGGYRPGWLEGGAPPGVEGLRFQLMAAAVPRAVPMSGWDLATRGTKASRLLAPVGSVYFCAVTGDGDLRQLWLRSIADREEDRLAGFGIVLMGGWTWPGN